MPTALPAPRTPDPTTAPKLRWAVVGPGWIGQRFVEAVTTHTGQHVVAVSSRSASRAERFAAQWGIDKSYTSYELMLSDPDIDIVYISTPHIEHHSCALAALAAGKHVLVEKPMGINASEAREVFLVAQQAGLFAGEAMWSKFLPKFDVIRQILDGGVLGELRTVVVDNGEFFRPDHRIYDPQLLGGPMLDMGIYPVSFAHWVLGAPEVVRAIGQQANDHINGQFSAVLGHAGGHQSAINTTIMADTPRDATIAGELGYLSIPGPYYQPGPFTIQLRDAAPMTYEEPRAGHIGGLHFSATEAARIIGGGGTASIIHPPSAVLDTLDMMDRIRHDLGIIYPGEEQ
ncbi:Gfo/Idh/MocA family protein [Mycobacterium sp. 4D054]|uniref:Gfo/Idh/MocA family protein n=1 Tax=unclassified Mycobacterium TaxID=2642494 RepID=UPI0021B210A0|nr:Gfo/Idh/MocA family oxidoreductase [Mycobacterium sp. SMC-8]